MHERAGTIARTEDLVDVEALLQAYVDTTPDLTNPAQRVVFGTSGHRGSAFSGAFTDAHIAAISASIAEYRAAQGITGPLFIGADTHPLSIPAERTAVEVLLAAGVDVRPSAGEGDAWFVPTPALSHAILAYNRGRDADDPARADGIVVTPSHNPPADGGFKYNPPHGGPADSDATNWIAARANELLERGIAAISRADADTVAAAPRFDFLAGYVGALAEVIDLAAIRDAGVASAAHPLGGASVAYWDAIRDQHALNLTVLGPGVDPQWGFMHLDWDGKIRMDPSSAHVMSTVDEFRDEFSLITGNDADADRHGIVTADGLMNPNHFLAVAIDYLLTHRPEWSAAAGIGKTLVSSGMIDRVVAGHGRTLLEVPVGFKWFVPGLFDGTVVFGGEESAGASFQRFDGTAWSTDKDGILLALLAAEIQAVTGQSPSERYRALVAQYGEPAYARIDAAATPAQKATLGALAPSDVTDTELAGDPITAILTRAPGNDAAIGGLKVQTDHAWFAARPSGTEDVMKIYAESFRGPEHLALVQQAAQALVARVLD
ncbi:phosphoglucomutase (alpha-D-glucose-1,6-bisphosphate-dependent) [Leucobacter chromiireducens]|uniref:Alpha-D-glucose phosphate-specific phosphoglucomutase n=1 Tax=Leucobacter chromiireducens subsp. chromiireducens TaxID=660067 RepID=A0ABS1SQ59_9MICO|nr:phosphoglucomutase (alpha-D-glucose-1,6-bisphosphate-dependent) [Leucobacter chromiireducens]MBL3690296.1 alpha-D-glucose phosphate-specific phosphoglucomutase [Leucobacter chromiireducens subsp. chromiireducens]